MGLDIKKVLGTVAPWLATALGGPLAGQAVSSIAQAMGLKPGAKQDDVQKALAAGQLTGDQLVAIKAADQEFEKAMTLAGFANIEALAEIAAKDRDSARNREIQVRDSTPRYGFYLITFGFFGTLLFVIIRGVPAESATLVNVMIGSLGTAWIGCVSYFFGSSSGSAAKTEIMAANGNGNK